MGKCLVEDVWKEQEQLQRKSHEKCKPNYSRREYNLREALALEAFYRTKVELYDWAVIATIDIDSWRSLYREAYFENCCAVLQEHEDTIRKEYPDIKGRIRDAQCKIQIQEDIETAERCYKLAEDSMKKGDHETAGWLLEKPFAWVDLLDAWG